jgi:hypothetical protein
MSIINVMSQNRGFVSLSIDPLMMTQGPYADSSKGELDFILRGGLTKGDHSEFGVYYECFQVIDYQGYGLFYNYKISIINKAQVFNKWEFLVGPEFGVIQRTIDESSVHFNMAINGEIRYFFNKNLGMLIASDLRYRPDLSHYYDTKKLIKHNGYIGLIYRW